MDTPTRGGHSYAVQGRPALSCTPKTNSPQIAEKHAETTGFLKTITYGSRSTQACYGIQPSVTLTRPLAKLPMASKAAGAFDKALAFSDKKVAGMTWLKKVPIVKNAAPR